MERAIKIDHHGGATSIPVTTGGSVDRICTGHFTTNAATPVDCLQGYRQNQPRVKRGKDDEAVQPRGTPSLPRQTTRKGGKVRKSRRAYNCQCNDGVKWYHPFGTNSNFQQMYSVVKTTIRQTQDMVRIQYIFIDHIENR